MNQPSLSFAFFPSFPNNTSSSFADSWSRIGDVYKNYAQQVGSELWLSSARIIQEHTTRAWLETSQSCMQALAQNAAEVQQRAFAQLAEANTKAGGIMSEEIRETVTELLPAPARIE